MTTPTISQEMLKNALVELARSDREFLIVFFKEILAGTAAAPTPVLNGSGKISGGQKTDLTNRAVVSAGERKRRVAVLKKFKGSLENFKNYQPSKHDWYLQ